MKLSQAIFALVSTSNLCGVMAGRNGGYGFGAILGYPHNGYGVDQEDFYEEGYAIIFDPDQIVLGEERIHRDSTGYGFGELWGDFTHQLSINQISIEEICTGGKCTDI